MMIITHQQLLDASEENAASLSSRDGAGPNARIWLPFNEGSGVSLLNNVNSFRAKQLETECTFSAPIGGWANYPTQHSATVTGLFDGLPTTGVITESSLSSFGGAIGGSGAVGLPQVGAFLMIAGKRGSLVDRFKFGIKSGDGTEEAMVGIAWSNGVGGAPNLYLRSDADTVAMNSTTSLIGANKNFAVCMFVPSGLFSNGVSESVKMQGRYFVDGVGYDLADTYGGTGIATGVELGTSGARMVLGATDSTPTEWYGAFAALFYPDSPTDWREAFDYMAAEWTAGAASEKRLWPGWVCRP